MINLEILSEDNVITLKTNKTTITKYMEEYRDNSWLKEFFKDDHPFLKSKIYMPEITLKKLSNSEDQSLIDLENAITLHKNLKLTDSQACDERLWISLCFGYFYDYMNDRWNVNRKTNLDEHWLIPHGQKRGLFFNGLSRLYWFAKISYDETLNDPYELTKFCFNDFNILLQMTYRGYANSKTVRLALIKALKQFVDDGGIYNRDLLREILKYVSFLGGAYILDSFSENELKEKIYYKLIELFVKEHPNQTIFKL